MAESVTQNASIALYHYLCQNIVGTDKHVKSIRMLNTVRDNLQSNDQWTFITSGSFGEGLQMQGSDIDFMTVVKRIEVCENTHIQFNADQIIFTMELKDTQPGFTTLRLVHYNYQSILTDCNKIGGDFYISNISFKERFSSKTFSTVHGPCMSDEDGLYDIATCLHSKLWITSAEQWVTRSTNSWPIYDVKQSVVKHGVLFVPLGVKGSRQEELEWRISFSVGEKLLINSFTHTQLLCYALLKILLKDVITLDKDCKDLLCSYFMKTIMFWISEELPLSIWKPENLISCYMRCFCRLIYCVEYKICAHYFIPENNLFENKIHGIAREKLLNTLYILKSYGWQCILLSDQISNLNTCSPGIIKETPWTRCLYAMGVIRFYNSQMFLCDIFKSTVHSILEKVIYMVLSIKSSKIKYLFTYYLSKFCSKSEGFLRLEDTSSNKAIYTEYNTYISTLLLSTRHDILSGWLMLASFFYKRKQHSTVLNIIQYSLLKCTPEKLYQNMEFSDIHFELIDSHVFRNMPIVRLWTFLLLGLLYIEKSELQPDELEIVKLHFFPPIVYAQFLSFLCHYHLKNRRQCLDSLADLQLTIEENYLIGNNNSKGLSYNMLGIGFQLLGDKEAARKSFLQSIEFFPNEKHNSAFQTLSLIN